jgi:hypothetical protein
LNKSNDYHDYVFCEGKLVGEFEEMYRNSASTPWHQDEQKHWIDVRLTKEVLQDLGLFHQIHDFDCGTGHYLNLIAKHSLAINRKSYGYDLSATACEKATSLFPQSSFSNLDLTQRATCAAFHDSRHPVECVSEAGSRHREYRKSIALLGSPSGCKELLALKQRIYWQGCYYQSLSIDLALFIALCR